MPRGLLPIYPCAIILLAACQSKPPAPPLPAVDLTRFEPAVRAAIEPAARAAAAEPSSPARATTLGMVLHAHDQLATAAACYRRALALGETNAAVPYYLGVVLSASGNYSQAIEPLRRSASQSSGARLKLADTLYSAGDLAAAQAEYRPLLAQNANLAQAHYGLGRTLTGDDAIAAFTKALALFPRYGAAQFALAAAYRRASRPADADQVLANYERDKTTNPPIDDPAMDRVYALSRSSTGLLRAALILDAEGRTPEALALHEQAVQSDPKLDQAWVNMISLYARLDRGADAERAYRQAVSLAPRRADAHYNFGVYCTLRERWNDARQAFEQALQLDPKNPEAAHNLGAVIERTGDWNRAAALFRQAIALAPQHRLAHYHLGRIYANQQRLNDALAEFEKAIPPADAQSPTYIYALGAVQARAGRRQDAIATLTRARDEAQRLGQPALVASIQRDLGVLSK